jgi:hypothetical protein
MIRACLRHCDLDMDDWPVKIDELDVVASAEGDTWCSALRRPADRANVQPRPQRERRRRSARLALVYALDLGLPLALAAAAFPTMTRPVGDSSGPDKQRPSDRSGNTLTEAVRTTAAWGRYWLPSRIR